MKINKLLVSNIKKISGNVLAIGDFKDDILSAIEKNTNIIECNILSNNMDKGEKGKSKGKNKKVQLNNLRKTFKKKAINYLICDYDKLNNYLKTFIKDSIYITKEKIYFCTNDEDKIVKKYNRYNTKIEIVECTDKKLVIIDTSQAKTNMIKDKCYFILDFIIETIDFITDLLLN